MKYSGEFCIILTGIFETLNDAKHALQDPFIEDFVEERGNFNFKDFDNISVASGITLGDLEIAQIDEETYQVSGKRTAPVINKRRADSLAELIEQYGMFDEVEVTELTYE